MKKTKFNLFKFIGIFTLCGFTITVLCAVLARYAIVLSYVASVSFLISFVSSLILVGAYCDDDISNPYVERLYEQYWNN